MMFLLHAGVDDTWPMNTALYWIKQVTLLSFLFLTIVFFIFNNLLKSTPKNQLHFTFERLDALGSPPRDQYDFPAFKKPNLNGN